MQNFAAELQAFVDRHGSKTAAAKALDITRVDLYRYLGGALPRPSREATLRRRMELGKIMRLDTENVTLLRTMLLHLVEALDLDPRTGRGERGGAAKRPR